MKLRHAIKEALSTVGFATAASAFVFLPTASARADYVVVTPEEAARLQVAVCGDEMRRVDNGDGTCDVIHVFTNTTASATFTIPAENRIVEDSLQFLVVGGGGAGSGNCGGGGGAGGLILMDEGAAAVPGNYTVRVGAGGAQSGGNALGGNGANSTFTYNGTTYTANGGGRAGNYGTHVGTAGGSGGGGSTGGAGGASTQAAPGVGHNGGTGSSSSSPAVGGGGGGAGGPGVIASGSNGGAGGPGIETDISGELVVYAAGGGGAGINGGAAGAAGGATAGAGTQGTTGLTGGAGVAGSGSGGGGAAGGGGTSYGGAGGSGAVIVRYTVPAPIIVPVEGGELVAFGAKTNWVDGELVLKYTNPYGFNELTLPGAVKAWVLAVGGGGAGANPGNTSSRQGGAGGGGAGGYVEDASRLLASGDYAIQVGVGGLSPAGVGPGGDGSDSVLNANGAELIRAYGGGGGGVKSMGSNGGSGGGGSSNAGGTPVAGQGNAGGRGSHAQAGAGGGGAGSSGSSTAGINAGGAGGAGKESAITGTAVTYAAGGGGGSSSNKGGLGGSGIGGTGGGGEDATAGQTNTGSGGGGGKLNTPGGRGGSGVVIIRILQEMPVKPMSRTVVYDGLEHEIYSKDETRYVLTGDVTADGRAAATRVGTYTFTATLQPGFIWSDGSTAAVNFTLTITQPNLVVQEFSRDGWQLGEAPSAIHLVVTAGATGPEVMLTEAQVTYEYATATTGPWSTTLPTTAGVWYMRAMIAETPDFKPPTTAPVTSFRLWDGQNLPGTAGEVFGYHATITVTGSAVTEAVTDFPMLVRLAKDQPLGFSYDRLQPNMADLRFYSADGETLLPFEVDEWHPDGESLIWVKVPEYKNGAQIHMCWGLLEGQTLPDAPASTEVWSDYVGVWHLSEEVTAATAATTKAKDSTANSLDAAPAHGTTGNTTTMAQMISVEGPIGNARINQTINQTNYNALQVPNYDGKKNLNGIFTISGWYKAHAVNGYPRLFSRKNNWTDTNGFEIQMNNGSKTQATIRGAGGDAHQITFDMPDLTADWVHLSAAYNGTQLTVFVNGQQVAAGEIETATNNGRPLSFGNNATVSEQSLNGRYDDLRLRTGAVSAAWAQAEFEQAKRDGRYTITPVNQKPDATFANYWRVEPVLPATEWGTGEEPLIEAGVPAYGGPAYFVIRAVGGETWTNDFPTAAGNYTIVFRSDAGTEKPNGTRSWTELATDPIIVVVTAHSPRTDLSGTAGSATLSGRVLLANNEPGTAAPILDQDYNQSAENSPAIYWEHSGETSIYFDNLKVGTEHHLKAGAPVAELCGATNIWTLADIYLGSIYTDFGIEDEQMRNSLPYSGTSAASAAEAMNLVMRNVIDAVAVSPCYTNGIGTIYFDAVNGWVTGVEDGYRLVVEVVVGEAAMQEVPAAGQWAPVEMKPLLRDVSVADNFVALDPTQELSLSITNGNQAVDSFYRVVVPLEIHEPVRFRIRRTSIPRNDNGTEMFLADRGGFILLDNIVVSYPAMRVDLSSFGWYDTAKAGKQMLGYENAWNVPFPALGDELHPRAQATYYTNPGDTNADVTAFITAANLHYRWRYLNQQANAWATVPLAPDTLDAPDALNIRNLAGEVLPGDVEFWYDLRINAPYYKYVDYADVSGFRISDFYSEEISAVTNRRDSAEGTLASCGTDWFVRLREGSSDYEGLDVVLCGPIFGDATNRVPMELVGNHIWRGYLKTPTNATGVVSYRIEARNLQTPGSTAFAENLAYWFNAYAAETLPVSGTLTTTGDEASWSTLPVDAATGYLLFQVDDATHSITIVHADYQDFREWSDAHTADRTFKSTSTDDSGLVGTSSRKVTYQQSFDNWQPMPATDTNHWREAFIPSSTSITSLGYDLYKSYPSMTTPNGWTAGPGMLIYGNYRDSQNDTSGRPNVALQMQGQGFGYVQFVDAANSPRGIESISYTARIGQFIGFDDFCYYDAPNKLGMNNYTLTTRVAYDTNNNQSFSGNASLSLVANYVPGVGGYEFRIEQCKATRSNGVVTEPNRRSQLLSFYKWVVNEETGKVNKTLLCSREFNEIDFPNTASMTGSFCPVYFSVSNDVSCAFLTAGVMRNASGVSYNSAFSNNSGAYYSIGYRDTRNDRLTGGTYGLVSANCPGVFQTPVVLSKPVGFLGGNLSNDSLMYWSNNQITFGGTSTSCLDDLAERAWKVTAGRMQSYYTLRTNDTTQVVTPYDDSKWGIRARTPAPQKLIIKTADPGKDDWTDLGVTNIVSTFGTKTLSGTRYKVDLFTTKDCSVRVEPVGEMDDVRVDIVIDELEIRQFRGDDSYNQSSAIIPRDEWENNDNYYQVGKTNFLFTSAWTTNVVSGTTTNGAVLLSAKRTLPNDVSSIRSPLMDGTYGRGVGLGMLSFSYLNAQANAKLLVQVATNGVSAGSIASKTEEWDSGYWTTVTNIDFSAMSETERRRGIVSCYFGYHGLDGVVRLAVDPTVVAAVSNVTDRTRFGEVWIDSILVRDEPAIDTRSWTGWNLRTVGDSSDTERFMYLPDYNLGAFGAEPAIGLSLALNNSVTDGVPPMDQEVARQNVPFVQTPVFVSNDVGSVTFRARKYDLANPQPAAVVLLGSRQGSVDGKWDPLGEPFIVSNNTYTTYSYTTDPGQSYKAFRLAVRGVAGAEGAGAVQPEGYDSPVRVLIDEVLVSEAVRARVAFRNVGAFRGVAPASINGSTFVPDVPSEKEQPLCNESWGVQCEVYAAQLPDEIDFSRTPRVKLYWFNGEYPWGFENWKTNRNCKSAYLARATDTNLVYRSSFRTAQDAVIPMSTAPGQVVQYSLEVEYYQVGAATPMTNVLSAVDWSTPAWYKPVDLNRDHGGEYFSAYNILDTVAPHWSWINEINLFGAYNYQYDNSDKNYQFVEVAVPAEADITGWKVRLLEAQKGTDMVITNTLGIFGDRGLSPTKPNLMGMASNMVFRVLANRGAGETGNLKEADGTLDAVWKIDYPTTLVSSLGEISAIDSMALQLVRASGIVEHEIVAIGTNWWSDLDYYNQQYHPTNTVNYLNAHMRDANFQYVGDDDGGLTASLGVFNERGATSNDWNNTMIRTPGRINEGQVIDPDHPTPNGSSILVYCNLAADPGHISQTIGDHVNTNGNVIVVIQKGLERGTNITYRVDPWYALGAVTENGKAKAATETGTRTYVVNVGANASNNVTVVAQARVSDELLALGLTDDNRYRPAVLDWLSKHKDAYGNDWANPDADVVQLADVLDRDDKVITNMTLTSMYWLDMDPTVGNLALKAHVFDGPHKNIVDAYPLGTKSTNIVMDVFMMITNRTENTADTENFGKAWSPYTLRGLEPGSLSMDYEWSTPDVWTSVTFKVTGFIENGLTGMQNRDNWLPLRWFVFHPDSFFQPGDTEGAPFTSKIEIKDPFGKESPGYSGGWYDWAQTYGLPSSVFYRFTIDERLKPFDPEILKKTNLYEAIEHE